MEVFFYTSLKTELAYSLSAQVELHIIWAPFDILDLATSSKHPLKKIHFCLIFLFDLDKEVELGCDSFDKERCLLGPGAAEL